MHQPLSWSLEDYEAAALYENRPGLVAFIDEPYRTIPNVGSVCLPRLRGR